jgi:hypothetical protein
VLLLLPLRLLLWLLLLLMLLLLLLSGVQLDRSLLLVSHALAVLLLIRLCSQ